LSNEETVKYLDEHHDFKTARSKMVDQTITKLRGSIKDGSINKDVVINGFKVSINSILFNLNNEKRTYKNYNLLFWFKKIKSMNSIYADKFNKFYQEHGFTEEKLEKAFESEQEWANLFDEAFRTSYKDFLVENPNCLALLGKLSQV
jgi:pantothenate kinase-related protein Tda10